MDEQRQQAYLDLAQALIQCPSDTESDILQAHLELLDEGLVVTLHSVAQMMLEKNKPESKSIIQWLTNFANELTEELSLNTEVSSDDLDSQLNFQIAVLQTIAESKGNHHVVYPLFQDNLPLLNEQLILVLKDWATDKFVEVGRDGQKYLAEIMRVFGNLIQQFPLGNRATNLEIAISNYELALTVVPHSEEPEMWAALQNSLAVAYSHRIRGTQVENLELSIESYQLALSVYTRESFPVDWAVTQNNLATAYNDRIRGERAENLELAIAYYYAALEVRTCEALPVDWAMTQNNLGNAYRDRIRGDRADNLELAIVCYQSALKVRTREAFPLDWAMTRCNLANAYRNRIRGERAENLEVAIECYQSALKVRTRETYPEQWAMTQNNLGNAYLNRIRGERSENLEIAIACYHAALKIRTKEDNPEKWAETQNNLATAYSQKIRGDRSENIEYSIACYQAALEIYTRVNFPEQWAMTQNNLATAYHDRIYGDRANNIEIAIECYQSALEGYTRQSFPEQWAMIQNNLGNIYADIDRCVYSIECFHLALEVRTPQLFPIDCLTTARNLGDLAFRLGDWQLAIDSYDIAIQSIEISRSWAINEDSRQRIISESLSVYENVIQVCVHYGQINLAIVYSERVRSQKLVDLMATKNMYVQDKVSNEVKAYLAEYELLEQKIHTCRMTNNDLCTKEIVISNKKVCLAQPTLIEHRYCNFRSLVTSGLIKCNRSDQLDIFSKIISGFETEKHNIWLKIRALDPVLGEQIETTTISYETIESLIQTAQTAILSFYTTDDNTYIFIMTRDREPLVHICRGQGWQSFQVWLRDRWLIPYTEDRKYWMSNFPDVLAQISKNIQVNELVSKLDGITELIIIPHLFLHQIPFAALPLTYSREGTENELLGDRFNIHYAPSCQILKYCQDRGSIEKIQHGIVENTNGRLPGAIFECQTISALFDIPDRYRLRGIQQGTVENFKALVQDSIVTDIHLAHHAQSRLDNPLESALQLANGNITLAQLLVSRYPHLNEIFLSCCETSLGSITITDDILTLATGFICAGARSVIGTLWAVDDLATALFSIFYYHNRYDGCGCAFAIKMAQVRLRNLTGAELQLNYYDDLVQHLTTYARTNKTDRKELRSQFARGEIDKLTFDRDDNQLRLAYCNALDSIDRVDRYCQADRPFAHPYYWAAFTCQGLA